MAVVGRAAALRAETSKKVRSLKHKALVDLLKRLQSLGLSYHASAADPRQRAMADLFQAQAAPLDFAPAVAPPPPSAGAAHLAAGSEGGGGGGSGSDEGMGGIDQN